MKPNSNDFLILSFEQVQALYQHMSGLMAADCEDGFVPGGESVTLHLGFEEGPSIMTFTRAEIERDEDYWHVVLSSVEKPVGEP